LNAFVVVVVVVVVVASVVVDVDVVVVASVVSVIVSVIVSDVVVSYVSAVEKLLGLQGKVKSAIIVGGDWLITVVIVVICVINEILCLPFMM